MASGFVKAIVDSGRFGFIAAAGSERDYFFHERDLVGIEWDQTLQAMRVEFDMVSSDRGPRAACVRAAR